MRARLVGSAVSLLGLGSANVLDLQSLPGAGQAKLYLNDPVRVKKEIGVEAVTDLVFPYVKTGVRYWPFLLVARDLEGKRRNVVETRLSSIKKHQRIESRGPGKWTSFGRYRSMYQAIPDDSKLGKFLSHKGRVYRGDFAFFAGREKAWKAALLRTLGKSAQAFAGLLKEEWKADSRLDDD